MLRVARERLHPDRLAILVVGDAAALERGDPARPEASLARFAGEAGIRRIPLPDPMTMEYPGR